MRYTPFKLEQYFEVYEFSAPYSLCNSDCEAMSVGELLELTGGGLQGLQDVWLGYTETQGDPALREAISTWYTTIKAENVLVMTGAQEGVFLFMNVALEAGDHVIVMRPTYQSLYQIAEDMGLEVSYWNVQEQAGNSWAWDVGELAEMVRPNTKAIIINTPNNPTGYLIPEADLQAIVELSRKHDLYVFSDEVYAGLELGDTPAVPRMCDVYEKAVSLGVMSKTFGLAGLRIGWLALADTSLLKLMQEHKYYTTICNSAPSEYLSTIALQHKEKIVERNRQIIEDNLVLARQFFSDYEGLLTYTPQVAGPVAFPRLREDLSSRAFCHQLVEEFGVLLLPGHVAEYDDHHFRFGVGRRSFANSLEQFAVALDKLFG